MIERYARVISARPPSSASPMGPLRLMRAAEVGVVKAMAERRMIAENEDAEKSRRSGSIVIWSGTLKVGIQGMICYMFSAGFDILSCCLFSESE